MNDAVASYKKAYEEMYAICEANGWGDPFSYARSREILMAATLNHQISDTLSGADAIDEDGEAEYKSTISKHINGAYNGISVQETWKEQERYLIENKIGKYENHYFARFQGGKIAEIWKLKGKDVLTILLPKLRDKFDTVLEKKDPRLGASVTKTEIINYGIKIYEAEYDTSR